MCEKHIKLFFCVHRREADNTLFVFILTEGSAAFAYDIIQFFRNSMDYIVNLFLRENTPYTFPIITDVELICV